MKREQRAILNGLTDANFCSSRQKLETRFFFESRQLSGQLPDLGVGFIDHVGMTRARFNLELLSYRKRDGEIVDESQFVADVRKILIPPKIIHKVEVSRVNGNPSNSIIKDIDIVEYMGKLKSLRITENESMKLFQYLMRHKRDLRDYGLTFKEVLNQVNYALGGKIMDPNIRKWLVNIENL